jgi:hypothetical protein
VVPAFDIGRLAGLSRTAVAGSLGDAWTSGTAAPFGLPVY